MTWALVYMLCTPTCIVEYVETYPSRSACVMEANEFKKHRGYSTKCVPVSKD